MNEKCLHLFNLRAKKKKFIHNKILLSKGLVSFPQAYAWWLDSVDRWFDVSYTHQWYLNLNERDSSSYN